MSRTKWWVLVVVLAMAAGGATWAFWPNGEQGPSKEVVALQDQMQKLRETGANLNAQQRDALRGQIRQQIEALPPEQRRQLFESGRERFRQQMMQHIDEYLNVPPAQRNAILDRHIDEMEQRMRQWRQSRGQGGPRPGAGRGPGGPPGPRVASAGSIGRPRGPRGPAFTPEQRNERRRRRLDATTPEQRAKVSEYIRAIRERRKERGLPDWPPRPPGRPR
jgi:hypothetical protein